MGVLELYRRQAKLRAAANAELKLEQRYDLDFTVYASGSPYDAGKEKGITWKLWCSEDLSGLNFVAYWSDGNQTLEDFYLERAAGESTLKPIIESLAEEGISSAGWARTYATEADSEKANTTNMPKVGSLADLLDIKPTTTVTAKIYLARDASMEDAAKVISNAFENFKKSYPGSNLRLIVILADSADIDSLRGDLTKSADGRVIVDDSKIEYIKDKYTTSDTYARLSCDDELSESEIAQQLKGIQYG